MRTYGECEADGCTGPRNGPGGGKGLCNKHYTRLRRGQDVNGKSRFGKTLSERFWEKVTKHPGDGCWLWTGSKNSKGYGHFRVKDGGATCVYKAHRWAWEEEHGPIQPVDLTIDHVVCGNTSCVRVIHMELVTRAENTRRARQRQRATA